jgi:hypothetical protein
LLGILGGGVELGFELIDLGFVGVALVLGLFELYLGAIAIALGLDLGVAVAADEGGDEKD